MKTKITPFVTDIFLNIIGTIGYARTVVKSMKSHLFSEAHLYGQKTELGKAILKLGLLLWKQFELQRKSQNIK